MAADNKQGDAASEAVSKASESLSQLLARVLEQLALSAWLPSAALTLLLLFIFTLGSVLDGTNSVLKGADGPKAPGAAISLTFEALGRTSVGGLLLIVITVIVMTMLTQAFTFESIRLLEGYWGVTRPLERLAQARAKRWKQAHRKLARRYKALTKRAWKKAKSKVETLPGFTAGMVTVLEAQVLGTTTALRLTDEKQVARVDEADWKQFAPGDLLRRRTNLDKKLDDFPCPQHSMPTRLGNVLRHYEDETGYDSVEALVDEVFDALPPSLRTSHDEQRGRLDLYCSMHLVLLLAGAIGVLRFGRVHWGYASGAAVIALLGVWVTYRAAVASARYYGSLLVIIAKYERPATAAGPAQRLDPEGGMQSPRSQGETGGISETRESVTDSEPVAP